jgi:pimeloyl-ACP methyl ester carboxylesterase
MSPPLIAPPFLLLAAAWLLSFVPVAHAQLLPSATESELRLTDIAPPLGALLALPSATPPRAGVIIIPGSGPTDRDGNNRLGIQTDAYRLLAHSLASNGIASLRIDKRGMFSSASPGIDPNAVTLDLYAADARRWLAHWRALEPDLPLYLLGHSEGGLVALLAAQDRPDLAGVILVACPGRPLGDVLRAQLRANPANAPLLAAAETAITELENGRTFDSATLPSALRPLFNNSVQNFLVSAFAARPAELVARLPQPVLVLQGDNDLQVSPDDARLLAAAQPRATLRIMENMNHILKIAPRDPAENIATYRQPRLPLAPALARELAAFIPR